MQEKSFDGCCWQMKQKITNFRKTIEIIQNIKDSTLTKIRTGNDLHILNRITVTFQEFLPFKR